MREDAELSDVEVFDARRCELGEGPFYEPQTGRVGWVDILGSAVKYRHLTTGETSSLDAGAHVGAAILRRDGGLVLCLPGGPVLRDDDGSTHPLPSYGDADRAAGVAPPSVPTRSNDAKPDPAGRLWLGKMPYDEAPVGALYRLDGDRLDRIVGETWISNGLGWSPDSSRMYFVDTPTNKVYIFDYDLETGTPTNRRTFLDLSDAEGSPDGMCVDADGGIWVAMWGGSCVRHYDADGGLVRIVEVPTAQTSSCAFAGENLDRLVVTTAATGLPDSDTAAGLTYVYQPDGIVGLPVATYAG